MCLHAAAHAAPKRLYCPTNAGFAELSAAFASGCSTADDVCKSAADKACGACVARNSPGSARNSIWLVTEQRSDFNEILAGKRPKSPQKGTTIQTKTESEPCSEDVQVLL